GSAACARNLRAGARIVWPDHSPSPRLAAVAALLLVVRSSSCCPVRIWGTDGLHIVKQVLDAGATIKVLDFPSLDLTTPEGRGFLALFSAMAERERIRIVKRTQEGRRLAMEAGKRMGRKPKLTAHQRRSARVRL